MAEISPLATLPSQSEPDLRARSASSALRKIWLLLNLQSLAEVEGEFSKIRGKGGVEGREVLAVLLLSFSILSRQTHQV